MSSQILTRLGSSPTLEDLRIKFNTITGYDQVEELRATVTLKDRALKDVMLDMKTQRQQVEVVEKERRGNDAARQALDNDMKFTSQHTGDATSTAMSSHSIELVEKMNEKLVLLIKNETRLVRLERDLKTSLRTLEDKVELALEGYTNALLHRYNVEQAWSDKIRKFSTYGTLGLMAFNTTLFLASHFVMIPRGQRKVTKNVTQALEASLQKNADAAAAHNSQQPQDLASASIVVTPQAEKEEVVRSQEDLAHLAKMREILEKLELELNERVSSQQRMTHDGGALILLTQPELERKLVAGACIVAAVCSAVLLISHIASNK